jgi:DNA-binding SARP family transcriptional activator
VLRLITLGRLQLLRDGPSSEPLRLQPKRLALLSFLALAASDGIQHRDTLLALFWPRSDQDRARRCLRQALFHLRNELGDGALVNVGREGIALAPGRLWCDALAVEQALLAGRRREALRLYAGDFLPGLCFDECDCAWEEWVERVRQRIRARVIAGAWTLVEEELRESRLESALGTARRARSLSPDDEQGLRRYMLVLARAGDGAAALGAYAEFTRRLRQEYDAEPSRESRALAETLRHGHLPPEIPRVATLARPGTTGGSNPGDGSSPHRRRRRTDPPAWVSRLALVATLLVAAFAVGRPRAPRPTPPVGGHLLLTQFTNHTHDSLLGAAVTEALRADLSRIAEVRLAGARASRIRSAEPLAPGAALAVVTGDVAALGAGYTVSARLVSPSSGRVLAVLNEDAADSKLLLRTVERLSRRLGGDVIESLAPYAEEPWLPGRIAGWVGHFPEGGGQAEGRGRWLKNRK